MITKIENITIYNGKGEVFPNETLIFDNESILGIGETGINLDSEDTMETIDGGGMNCLPGMFDMHVHLNMDATPDPSELIAKDNEAMAAYRSLANAKKHLQAGVTTIRNCGSKYDVDITLRNAIQESLFYGPNIFASGQPIVMTGGHGHYFSTEADGEEDIRKAARRQLKKGADLLKLMATGGGLTPGVKPGATQLSEEEMQVAIVEACNAEKISAAHAQGNEGIKNAIRAGITTIEHGVYLDKEAIDLMLEKNTVLVATLAAPYNVIKNGENKNVPEYAIEKNKEASIPHRESFQRAYESGVKIAAGTDAGTPMNYHGDYVTELEIMKELGMNTQDIICSATSIPAEVLGVDDKRGSIKVGKQADIVIVDGDIEDNISNLRNVKSVYLRGEKVFQN